MLREHRRLLNQGVLPWAGAHSALLHERYPTAAHRSPIQIPRGRLLTDAIAAANWEAGLTEGLEYQLSVVIEALLKAPVGTPTRLLRG